MMLARRWLPWFACLAAWLVAQPVAAKEFRVETTVYENDVEEPVAQVLTLFQDGLVYEFLSQPDEVRVYKTTVPSGTGVFILLDPRRRLRTEIATSEIANFMEAVRQRAAEHKNPLMQFAAQPKFEESFVDGQSNGRGELTMSSELMSYRIKTVPAANQDDLITYHRFSDWNAQLNAMLNVGSTPPFPRLLVGQAMKRRGVLPEEIVLTITTGRSKEEVIRATSETRWRLSQQDRQRIDQVAADLVQFKQVGYDRYRR